MARYRRNDLDKLVAVTDVAWAAASQRLRKQAALEQAAAQRMEDLASARRRNLDGLVGADHPDPGMIAATSGWMLWSERERQRLNVELARARAATAAEQAKARKAFGKRQAARKLRENELAKLLRSRVS